MARLAQAAAVLCVCLLFTSTAYAEDDYYDVLDLPQKEDASEREIKKQFRKMSLKHHPDHNPSEEARARYNLIQRANEVLSDRRKRKIYDMRGEEGLKQLEDAERNPNKGMNDPFASFFGGSQQDAHKGKDVHMNLQVELRELYNGAATTLTLNKQKLCRACRGSGAESGSALAKCKQCGGKGTVMQRVQIMPGFVQQMQQPCPACGGKGKTIKKKCPKCKGKKVFRGDYSLEIEIERGVPDGHKLVFDMEADQSPDLIPGDVIFTVQTKPDRVFTRRGKDLEMTLKISLKEALFGFTRHITHMDGRSVAVVSDAVSQHGRRMKVAGEGMPLHNVPSEKGDLYVTLEFELPRFLSESQKNGLLQALS